jgi:hypothetical protein
MTPNLGLFGRFLWLGRRLLIHGAIVEIGRIEISVDIRSSCIVSHVDGCFFILQSLDNVKDVFFNLLDMLGIDKGSNFAD